MVESQADSGVREEVLKEREKVLKEKAGDSASADKVQRYKLL